MSKTAYLVAHVAIRNGVATVVATGIYGEGANSLESAIGPGRFAFDVLKCSDESYELAKGSLLKAARFNPSVYGWALELLPLEDREV